MGPGGRGVEGRPGGRGGRGKMGDWGSCLELCMARPGVRRGQMRHRRKSPVPPSRPDLPCVREGATEGGQGGASHVLTTPLTTPFITHGHPPLTPPRDMLAAPSAAVPRRPRDLHEGACEAAAQRRPQHRQRRRRRRRRGGGPLRREVPCGGGRGRARGLGEGRTGLYRRPAEVDREGSNPLRGSFGRSARSSPSGCFRRPPLRGSWCWRPQECCAGRGPQRIACRNQLPHNSNRKKHRLLCRNPRAVRATPAESPNCPRSGFAAGLKLPPARSTSNLGLPALPQSGPSALQDRLRRVLVPRRTDRHCPPNDRRNWSNTALRPTSTPDSPIPARSEPRVLQSGANADQLWALCLPPNLRAGFAQPFKLASATIGPSSANVRHLLARTPMLSTKPKQAPIADWS